MSMAEDRTQPYLALRCPFANTSQQLPRLGAAPLARSHLQLTSPMMERYKELILDMLSDIYERFYKMKVCSDNRQHMAGFAQDQPKITW